LSLFIFCLVGVIFHFFVSLVWVLLLFHDFLNFSCCSFSYFPLFVDCLKKFNVTFFTIMKNLWLWF
jgi:hypothetical protein